MKRALIIGITGQDGAYLSTLLLHKGYEVHGVLRRSSCVTTERINALILYDQDKAEKFFLHHGDITDVNSCTRIIVAVQPDEIYNLAGQSDVAASFEMPEYTAQVDALGPVRILEVLRVLGLEKKVRFYQASTSELFGNAVQSPQNEFTPFNPQSPYATAKAYAYWITKNYRDAYGMFACNGILFNHESPYRGHMFVTRKITRAVAAIAAGAQDMLYLGNLDAVRDWGHAQDYVRAMWLMMQHSAPLDLVIATGESHTVRSFVSRAFACVGIEIAWSGSQCQEYGYDSVTGKKVISVDARYFRPMDVHHLCGDASKAQEILGWRPTISFDQLIAEMVKSDVAALKWEKFQKDSVQGACNIIGRKEFSV